MVSSERNVAKATILAASLMAGASAFTLPSTSSRIQPQCRPKRPRHPLFVRSKENLLVEESKASENDEGDVDSLLAAQDALAKSLSPPSSSSSSAYDIKPAYATAEEASIYLADAPVTPQEGANVAEEGPLTGDGLFWRGVVVILCALWASNFAFAKLVISQPGVDTSLYSVARFGLAATSLVPGSINAARKGNISWETARGAAVCGMWVAFGYLGQLIGLMTTTPSRACVICSLNCIFVAIVAETMRINSAQGRGFTTSFDLKKLAPALIAVTGVAIIELKGAGGAPTIGDLICFAQPVGFGMGYLQLEELMRREPSAALPVSAIKLLVVAMASLVFFEASPHAVADLVNDADAVARSTGGWSPTVPDFAPILASPVALGAIFYTGLITTSLALYVESIAFQRVPATDASIILTTEPLFAAAVSAYLVGETFGASDAVGAFFIVGACVYAIRMGEAEEVCDAITKECIVADPFE